MSDVGEKCRLRRRKCPSFEKNYLDSLLSVKKERNAVGLVRAGKKRLVARRLVGRSKDNSWLKKSSMQMFKASIINLNSISMWKSNIEHVSAVDLRLTSQFFTVL